MQQPQYTMESPIEELCRFRKSNYDPDNLEIPEAPQNRRETDRKYVIILLAVVIILVPFVVYTLNYADYKHLIQTDSCGNLCGYNNKKYEEWNCTGQDFTKKPYLLIRGIDARDRICVESCPPDSYEIISCKKIRDDNADDILEAAAGDLLEAGSWIIVLSMLITCSLCFGTILLFKYAVDFVVWFLLTGAIGLLAIAAGLFWFAYMHAEEQGKDQARQGFLYLALVTTGLVIVLILVITCMFKRVQLIIQLFKEAAKAIFEIPSLIYVPIYTFTTVTIIASTFILNGAYTLTAAKLVEVAPNYLSYQPNGVMIFTMLYNLFVYLWVLTFIGGAQYIIIAGAVSAWFFTRNKHYLEYPLSVSFMNFFKFHLGTVLIGSLIITIVNFVRMLIKALAANSRTRWLVECCCAEILGCLRLYSKNTYIETALHGQPFFKSGKRAVSLFVRNVENVVALNSIGNFVLIIAQVLLISVCSAISFFIAKVSGNPEWVPIGVICSSLTILMVAIFFAIFEATIDSIFMCFCEDTTLNDGMARPFFMSKGLRQFIENCKGVIPAKK